ncbi:dihydroorotase [Aeropyrum pernix K1]|uniref:Dihydroorotase n=1 Tax=Aeropyrum pernix (strain ATCC 700893 / DSM 11879 / JCM 9820 / NBRC 100138 / K1) TaxID=272557 RepID=PYRC_AERPE|nr:dihydroorotase [Aeropyrum pernix]Q9YFI5.2 RecName: Full=Dihydroorotase; Short=DHOase [Aeropyrum pernix K1]BAA79176.2 dihydroorotase [Aeropyrum pernix K1]
MAGWTVCVDFLYTGDKMLEDACAVISGERVERVHTGGFRGQPDLDLRGRSSLALPGVIDMHVHLRGLKLSYKEDEVSGTAAAASGCVTLVADMPNTQPPLRTPEALREKLASLEAGAKVDYTVYAGVPRSYGEAVEMASMGIAGFKIYPEDLVNLDSIKNVLEAAEEAGILVVLHPESHDMFAGPDYGWLRRVARPCHAEAASVELLHDAARECGCKPRVHITHASCPATVVESKKRGFTVDVTPHHLFLSEEEVAGPTHSWGKVNPPLRGVGERSLLTQLTIEGLVDAIASDHAPHSTWEKWMHPAIAPPGFPWLEWWPGFTAARLMRAVGLERFYSMVSQTPSTILGVGDRCLWDGCPATISVLQLERTRVYHKGYTKALYTPVLGMESFDCAATVIRGKIAYTAWEGVRGGATGVLATRVVH